MCAEGEESTSAIPASFVSMADNTSGFCISCSAILLAFAVIQTSRYQYACYNGKLSLFRNKKPNL